LSQTSARDAAVEQMVSVLEARAEANERTDERVEIETHGQWCISIAMQVYPKTDLIDGTAFRRATVGASDIAELKAQREREQAKSRVQMRMHIDHLDTTDGLLSEISALKARAEAAEETVKSRDAKMDDLAAIIDTLRTQCAQANVRGDRASEESQLNARYRKRLRELVQENQELKARAEAAEKRAHDAEQALREYRGGRLHHLEHIAMHGELRPGPLVGTRQTWEYVDKTDGTFWRGCDPITAFLMQLECTINVEACRERFRAGERMKKADAPVLQGR
jgi:hypothetical protein